MGLDEYETIKVPYSLKDNELERLKFPLKRDVLFDLVKKNNLENVFEEYEESEKGVLIARFRDDVFKIWATDYETRVSGVKRDPNIIVYEESVLYNGEGKVGNLSEFESTLQANVTIESYTERKKIRGFNVMPFFLEKSFSGKNTKKRYKRKISRIDDNPGFHFLTKNNEIRATPINRKNFGVIY